MVISFWSIALAKETGVLLFHFFKIEPHVNTAILSHREKHLLKRHVFEPCITMYYAFMLLYYHPSDLHYILPVRLYLTIPYMPLISNI